MNPRLVRVRFVNVGRHKRCWEADVSPTASSLLREVHRECNIRDITVRVTFDPDTGKGAVKLGNGRVVGAIELVDTAQLGLGIG